MPMSDDEFDKLLRKLGVEDLPPTVVRQFREALEKYDAAEDVSPLTAKIALFVLEKDMDKT